MNWAKKLFKYLFYTRYRKKQHVFNLIKNLILLLTKYNNFDLLLLTPYKCRANEDLGHAIINYKKHIIKRTYEKKNISINNVKNISLYFSNFYYQSSYNSFCVLNLYKMSSIKNTKSNLKIWIY